MLGHARANATTRLILKVSEYLAQELGGMDEASSSFTRHTKTCLHSGLELLLSLSRAQFAHALGGHIRPPSRWDEAGGEFDHWSHAVFVQRARSCQKSCWASCDRTAAARAEPSGPLRRLTQRLRMCAPVLFMHRGSSRPWHPSTTRNKDPCHAGEPRDDMVWHKMSRPRA